MNTVIRASSLPGYSDCQRRWAARTLHSELRAAGYDVSEHKITSIGASVGTGVHGGAAVMLLEKMKNGEVAETVISQAGDFAINELTEKSKEGVLWDKATENMNDAQKQVLRMLTVYRLGVMPNINPVAVERRLEADLGNGFTLSGQSDLQTLQPGDIRDTKTGTVARQHFAQIGSYSLLARTRHKEFPVTQLHVDFIPRVSMKKPQPEAIVEEYDQVIAENAAQATIDHIKTAVAEFRRRVTDGDAPPENAFLANPSSMLCSAKWCPAHGTNFCREHKK